MTRTTMLFGCDFSSAPSARKPIVMAIGEAKPAGVVRLSQLHRLPTLDAWSRWLETTDDWVGGFDLPFGLPRELVAHLDWPRAWPELIGHYAAMTRPEIRDTFAAFCAARPVGGKFAHRATDGPAGSSPSMKWVNPPVAFMLHAGVPRLLRAGATFPGLYQSPQRASRIALEAYPGLLARELIGRRSYKSDDLKKQTGERAAARVDLLAALERGATRLEVRLALEAPLRDQVLGDARGDLLDAVLCLVQAAWAVQHAGSAGPGYGLPPDIDPVEGWIVTA